MTKCIKKWMKCCISFMLIFGLVLPSYAALSASDASVFVTKGEFDTIMAEYNSQLTTVEAGINTKIDSQVTSYLDNNGVWNGANQTIAMTPTKFNAPARVDSSDTHFSVKLVDKKVIEKINKSGLCYVNWTVRCPNPRTAYQSGIGYRFNRSALGNTTFHNAQNFDLQYLQNGDVITVQELAKCNCIYGNQGSGTYPGETGLNFVFWYVPQNYYYGTSLFFVEKDLDLSVVLLMSYYFNYMTFNANESSECEFNVTNCVVY